MSDSVYESYKPQKINIPGAKQHPGKLVESAAMSVVEPPDPTYTPNLPQKIISEGRLSAAQLESIVYAGQAHQELLPSGERKGYFIGDGTGVGKGREIAGILFDNWRQGRKRAIWISQNSPLIEDAKRDVKGTGWDDGNILDLSKAKISSGLPKGQNGTYFVGYALLKSKDYKAEAKEGKEANSRLKQLVEWFGKDYDGVIVFDEAHNMGNALATKGKRGTTKPSAQALAGIELQRQLPNARVVYVSATGATEVTNLSYADRLGLWGEGTPFANKADFVNQIASGGIAAMELVARDMKSMGDYLARSLSYDDVKYESLNHALTSQQREVYDEFATAWQVVLSHINEALDITNGAKSGKGKSAAMAQFWGSSQRFFNQVITSMQTPAVVNSIEKDLKAGNAVVIQIVNTNEAATGRALARMEEGSELEDLDLTPKEQIMDYVKNSFPVAQYQEVEDENGNKRYEVVLDSQGNPVENAEAVELRENLLNKLGGIRGLDGPMEILLNHFGTDKVAEITGRTRRVVYAIDDKGNRNKVIEHRSRAKTMADADAFMSDKKPILIFSYAGGTGRSYHADLAAKNQRLRRHYLLQAGWRADRAIQGFGRTHRSSQKQAPEYILVTTDIIGQKRFISSIARRLDQLGALTRGQRETGSGGFFTARDNLESVYAQDALDNMIMDIYRHRGPMSMGDFMQQTGLTNLIDKNDGSLNESNLPTVTQFLNRLLAMHLDKQVEIFEDFSSRMDANIRSAMESGDLDIGLETLKAKNIKKISEQVVHTDKSGAQTKYVELDVTRDSHPLDFENSVLSAVNYYKNIKSGQVWGASIKKSRTNGNTGEIEDFYTLRGPARTSHDVKEGSLKDPEKYENISKGEAKKLWDAEYEAFPKTITYRENLITGTVLPIWDRLKGKARIMRVQTDEGERMIGRLINHADLDATLQRLGASSSKVQVTPREIFSRVRDQGYQMELANGWKIVRRKVAGENRIEVTGADYKFFDELKRHGAYVERIQWDTRIFLPTDETGIKAIEAITENRPVVNQIIPAKIKEDMGTTEQAAVSDWTNIETGHAPYTPTLEDVKSIFKGQEVFEVNDPDGTHIAVKTRAGFVSILEVDHISPDEASLKMGYGELAPGYKVVGGYGYDKKMGMAVIKLAKEGSSKFHLAHESVHYLEDMGLLNSSDIDLLKRHINYLVKEGKFETKNKSDIGGSEDRANFLADALMKEPHGFVGRVVRMVQEFIDKLAAFLDIKTAGAVVRKVQSGKVFEALDKTVSSILDSKEQYAVVSMSDETATPDMPPEQIKSGIRQAQDAIIQTIANKLSPDVTKMGMLKKILLSPEYYDHPVLSRIVRLFARDRNEIYHEIFQHLNGLDNFRADEDTIQQLAVKLKNKGLSIAQRMKGETSKEYKDLSRAIDEGDTTWQRDPKASLEENLRMYEDHLRKSGMSDDTIKVWKAFRESYDKALDLMTQQMREMKERIEEEAAFKGIDPADYSELWMTLKGAIAYMETWKGFYAPRQRQGNWAVTGFKGEGDDRQYYREHRTSELAARRLAEKLKAEGYTINNVKEVDKLPEDIYQDIKAVSVAKAIEAALEKMGSETSVKFNEELLRNVADEFKARGFRGTMIHRGEQVVKGYIEDPIERHLLYTNNVARGLAKAKVAQKAYAEMSGTVVDGKRVGGIDAVKEPQIYTTAKDYIEEQLRNLDTTDRWIGWAKSIATLKFLGFSTRSAVVNLTSMATTAPVAIRQYAGGGNVGFLRINREIARAGKDYAGFMVGRDVQDKDEKAFLQEEKRLGWDDAQYTRDAVGAASSLPNKAWTATMDAAMFMFGKTEQWNRGATMLAAYRIAKSQGMTHAEAMEAAKTSSDKAHGIYGRGTLPSVAWGRNPAAKVAQMLYTYSKFSHNYLQMMYELGFRKKDVQGFIYGMMAPVLVSGLTAFAFKDVWFPIIGILLSALGAKDKDEDTEKWFWDGVRKHMGSGAESAGRYGILGALGVDVSGSLSIGVGIPRNVWEWAGPIGGAAKEISGAKRHLESGNYLKAAEKLLPAGLANPVKAYRESEEGVSTNTNRRVWDESGKPLTLTGGEAFARGLGFRSTRQATLSERTMEGHEQQTHFKDMRNDLYERYRAWVLSGKKDRETYAKIFKDVREFNAKIAKLGLRREVAPITTESLRNQAKRMNKPSKQERAILS